jgi:hypothetical protein
MRAGGRTGALASSRAVWRAAQTTGEDGAATSRGRSRHHVRAGDRTTSGTDGIALLVSAGRAHGTAETDGGPHSL